MTQGQQLTDLLEHFGSLAHCTATRRGFYPEGWGLLAGAGQLAEEVTELAATTTTEEEELELADCFIALISIAHHRGIKLGAAVLRKMAINMERAAIAETAPLIKPEESFSL